MIAPAGGGAAVGGGPILLAGFLGGLISRMQRLVYGRGRPTAYGASWVPLFLAPLLGALAAWAGLHLLALLQGLDVVSLTGVLPPGSDFRMDPAASVLGIAVLLGFSERLFNQLGDHADQVLQGEQEGGSPATAGSPASPFGAVAVPGPRRPPTAETSGSNGAPASAGDRQGRQRDGPRPVAEGLLRLGRQIPNLLPCGSIRWANSMRPVVDQRIATLAPSCCARSIAAWTSSTCT